MTTKPSWMLLSDGCSRSYNDPWELVLQSYLIPLGDFTAENDALDLRQLRAIRFVFDRAHAGEVSIDQIGISDLDPAFLSARVERGVEAGRPRFY